MTWHFLSTREVKTIQARLINDFGGSHGLRDEGLLESSVTRARNKALYEEDATAAMIAASVSYGLIKNHAFIDGNKRIGLAVLIALLEANSHELAVSHEAATEMVLSVASSEMSENDWTAWVKRSATLSENA